MAINLHTKYSDQLAKLYTHNSFVDGHTNKTWDFSGLKSILIPSITTQALANYSRTGTTRYGSPADLQDTVQELTMTQDKAFSIVIDKGDNSEQQMMKRAGEVLNMQIAEQVTPSIDKYALEQWATFAGKSIAMANAPAVGTIVGALLDAETHFADNNIPDADRWCYIPNSYVKLIRTSTEFSGCDGLVDKMVVKGQVGRIGTLNIVAVPTSYMPTNVYFICTQKNSVILAQKLRDSKIHQDPPGISGHLLEGRYNYDAFVVGTLCDGVYIAVASGYKAATPTVAKTTTTAITSTTSNAVIKYTLDGTDPRYSPTAATYSQAITNPDAGTILKAVAYTSSIYFSDVATHTCA